MLSSRSPALKKQGKKSSTESKALLHRRQGSSAFDSGSEDDDNDNDNDNGNNGDEKAGKKKTSMEKEVNDDDDGDKVPRRVNGSKNNYNNDSNDSGINDDDDDDEKEEKRMSGRERGTPPRRGSISPSLSPSPPPSPPPPPMSLSMSVLMRHQSWSYVFRSYIHGLKPPVFDWARSYSLARFRSDLVAGITVGVLLVPQSMAYAFLAGVPPIYGLYSSFVPLLVFSLFTSSMQVAIGPFSLISLLTYSAVSTALGEKEGGEGGDGGDASEERIRLSIACSLLNGIFQVLMGLLNFGSVSNYLARPVMTGFISASAIIIIISQAGAALGVSAKSSEVAVLSIVNVCRALPQTNFYTLLIAAASLAVFVGVKYVRAIPKWFPVQLVVMGAGVLLGWLLDLEKRGVALVGEVPRGLAAPAVPSIRGAAELKDLAVPCLVIALVSYVNAFALASQFAAKHKRRVNSNSELVALGSANLVGSFFNSHPVGASLSRTAINDALGASSPVANALTGVFVMLVLLTITSVFRYLPKAILAATVISSIYTMVDVADMVRLWRIDRQDFLLEAFAFVCTLCTGLTYGIFLSVAFSMIIVVHRASRPKVILLGQVPETTLYRNERVFPNLILHRGINVVRVDSELFFANVASVRSLLVAMAKGDTAVRAFVIDGSGINYIDSSGLDAFKDLIQELRELNVFVVLAGCHGYVIKLLKKVGTAKLMAEAAISVIGVESSHEFELSVDEDPAPDALENGSTCFFNTIHQAVVWIEGKLNTKH